MHVARTVWRLDQKILGLLEAEGPLRMSAIRAQNVIPAASVLPTVDRLVDAGKVTKFFGLYSLA